MRLKCPFCKNKFKYEELKGGISCPNCKKSLELYLARKGTPGEIIMQLLYPLLIAIVIIGIVFLIIHKF